MAEYLDFANVFFKKSVVVLPEYIEINTYTIILKRVTSQLIDSFIA